MNLFKAVNEFILTIFMQTLIKIKELTDECGPVCIISAPTFKGMQNFDQQHLGNFSYYDLKRAHTIMSR